MDDSGYSPVSLPIIPLASNEAFWEWDLASDNIYFSEGARKLLGMSVLPGKMDSFLEYVDPENLPLLLDIRSKIIKGQFNGVAEYDYLFNNNQRVHEYLFTLSRNSGGLAMRLMARLAPAEASGHKLDINPLSSEIARTGVWMLNAVTGKIWKDRVCSTIMGFPEVEEYPLTSQASIGQVHENDRAALERHFELFINGDLKGDTITDIVRVKHAKGHYLPVLIRASAVERDENGRAVILSGLMAPASPENMEDPFSKGDRLFHALNSMGVGQWNWDAKKGAIWYCPRYLAILGYPSKDCATFKDRWRYLVHPDDLAKIEGARETIINSPAGGDTFECTYRMKDAAGTWVWIFDRGCVTWRDTEGRAAHMVGSITNITTAQAERDRLEELVRHDTLTGLRSRAFCNLEMEHIEQNHIRPVTAISIDITGLKLVNDSLGHAAGDKLLTRASAILRGALRASDFISRIGGDEFLVLLPNCDQAKGQKLLQKIIDAFDNYNSKGANMPVLAACGFASAADMGESLASVIARADQDMYQRKRKARQADHAILRKWIRTSTGKEAATDDRLGET